MSKLLKFLTDRKGATAIEYCLIAGIVSLAVVTGATLIGHNLNHTFQAVVAAN